MIVRTMGAVVYAVMAAVGYIILAPFALAAKVESLFTRNQSGD